jgi:hypothetical protein
MALPVLHGEEGLSVRVLSKLKRPKELWPGATCRLTNVVVKNVRAETRVMLAMCPRNGTHILKGMLQAHLGFGAGVA